MDSFFGIGLPELVFILILAGLVMGPQQIRRVARTLGRFIGQMQDISAQFKDQINRELDAMDSEEMKGAIEDVRLLREEMNELRRQVRSIPEQYIREGRAAASEGQRAFTEGQRTFKPVSRSAPRGQVDNNLEGLPTPLPVPDNLPTPIEVADDPE